MIGNSHPVVATKARATTSGNVEKPTSSSPTGTAAPVRRQEVHGLAERAANLKSTGDAGALAPRAAISLPPDMRRLIASKADPATLVAMASASRESHAELAPQLLSARLDAATTQAMNASTGAQFEAAAEAISRLPAEHRAGPTLALARNLEDVSRTAPLDTAVSAHGSVMNALERLPVGNSDRKQVLDTTLHLLKAGDEIVRAVSMPVTPRFAALFERLTPDEVGAQVLAPWQRSRDRLRPQMLAHKLANDQKAVDAILDTCIGPRSHGETVRYAITRFQAVMASADSSADMVTGLTKLANHAASVHGVRTIPPNVPDDGFDWGDKAARNIEHFMNARQIPISEHPELQTAVASLRSSRAAG